MRSTTPSPGIPFNTAKEDDDISTQFPPVLNYQIPSPTYVLHFPHLSTPEIHPQEHLLRSLSHTPHSETFRHSILGSNDDIIAESTTSDEDNYFATNQIGCVIKNNYKLIRLLTYIVEDLFCINLRNGCVGISDQYPNFFSQYKQSFELDFYIRRLVENANCSTAAFVIMLVYLDRNQGNCKELMLTEMNCHRLLCTALVLAIKYLDDEVFSNSYYARVGGLTPDEMNLLELDLLNILDWNLSISAEVFSLYEERLNGFANHLHNNGSHVLPIQQHRTSGRSEDSPGGQ